jgi:hypothetical protein
LGGDEGEPKTQARRIGVDSAIESVACLDTKTGRFTSIIPNDGDDYTVCQHSKSTIANQKISMTHRRYLLILLTLGLCGGIVNDRAMLAMGLAQARTPAVTSSILKAPTLNTLVVPGKSVGAITAKTTYADLVKLFGKQRLSAKKVYGAEGQVEFPGTLITLGKNRSLTVAWKDAKKLQPIEVRIGDPAWSTASGIRVGTSLAKLRQVLGEFKISGLYWDYGNQVIDLSPATQARYYGLDISVDADPQAAKQFPADLNAVTGDGVTFAAKDPHWQRLKMHVSYMINSFIDKSDSSKPGN